MTYNTLKEYMFQVHGELPIPDSYTQKLLSAFHAFKRGGPFLQEVFKKEQKELSGEECMQLMNTYGISPREVYLMAMSHSFSIDISEFITLLIEQKKEQKNLIKCTNNP